MAKIKKGIISRFGRSMINAIFFTSGISIVWMSLELIMYGEVQNRGVDNIIAFIMLVCFTIMLWFYDIAKEYHSIEMQLNEVYTDGAKGQLKRFVDMFLAQVNEGKSFDGFRILTDEDAVLYDEWKASRNK